MTSQEYLLQALQGENLGSAPESSLRLQKIYTFIHKAKCIWAYDIAIRPTRQKSLAIVISMHCKTFSFFVAHIIIKNALYRKKIVHKI